jgi:hypothetical protein
MTRRKDPLPDVTAEPALAAAEPEGPPAFDLPQPDLPEPEPVVPPDRVVSSETKALPTATGPGLFGALLGGALAAIGGFGLSHFNLLGLAAPDNSDAVTALSAEVEAAKASQAAALDGVGSQLATLDSRLTSLETAPAPDLSRLDALDERLAAIEALPTDGTGGTAALAARIADLDRRLTNLPATGSSPDVQAQLDAALARLDAAETAAKEQTAQAAAEAEAARRARSLDALTAAVGTGGPFTAELQALDDAALTATLGPLAEAGVPTLAALRADFPAAARDALSVARDLGAEDGWSDRLVDFLAAQTRARSLTPREGADPDAILSRAEFALSEGRVADALSELGPLDPAVKAPLTNWIAAADRHLAAAAALNLAGGQ